MDEEEMQEQRNIPKVDMCSGCQTTVYPDPMTLADNHDLRCCVARGAAAGGFGPGRRVCHERPECMVCAHRRENPLKQHHVAVRYNSMAVHIAFTPPINPGLSQSAEVTSIAYVRTGGIRIWMVRITRPFAACSVRCCSACAVCCVITR